jgi:hypothetical protein
VRRSRSIVTSVLFVAFLGAAPSALAAPPDIVREPVLDEFVDTESCGFPVEVHAVGSRTGRTFDRPGTGVQFVGTVNVTVTLSANGNTVRLKDVGADVVTRRPDGTLVLSIIGQVPFGFTGVLKIDLDTGEVIQEPRHEADVDAICAALAP